MEEKLSLPFINNGKPFTVGNWTVEKHELALQMMGEELGNLSPEQTEREIKYYIVFIGLSEIDDSTITLNMVRNLHVDNLIELFKIIYYKGRVDIFFHQSDKKKTKKKE